MNSRSRTNRLAFGCSLAAGIIASPSARAEPAKRFPFDDAQVHRLSVTDPDAAKLFENGEERLRQADFAKAAELFRKAAERAPAIGIVHRRHCQALTELGRQSDAVAACERALKISATPMDQRAMVAALMLGDRPLEVDAVNQAIHIASVAKERLHDQPWGLAAECDIARHLRDERAYQGCVESLLRQVPGHYETERAAAIVPPARSFWRLLGWLVVGGTVAFTAGHALRRKLRVSTKKTAGALAAILVGALAPRQALAQEGTPSSSSSARPEPGEEHWQLSRWHINPNDPESSVPTPAERNTNPLEFGYHLQDLAAEAQKAEDKGDHRTAVKFWRALAKAVPDSNAGFFRACKSYELQNEREKAIDFCGKALTLPPDYPAHEAAHFAKLVLAKDGTPSKLDIQALDQLTAHLRESKKPLGAYYSELIQCDLALELGDEPRLVNCTQNLAKIAPDDPHTISYQWSLAVKREDFSAAQKAIEHGRALAMKPEALAELERGTKLAVDARHTRRAKLWLGLGGFALLVGLIVVGLRRFAQQRKATSPAPPASEPA